MADERYFLHVESIINKIVYLHHKGIIDRVIINESSSHMNGGIFRKLITITYAYSTNKNDVFMFDKSSEYDIEEKLRKFEVSIDGNSPKEYMIGKVAYSMYQSTSQDNLYKELDFLNELENTYGRR